MRIVVQFLLMITGFLFLNVGYTQVCRPTMSAEQAFLTIKQPKSSVSSTSVSALQTPTNPNVATINTPTLININTATEAQLAQLKGIGAKKAQDIITYRTMIAPFKSVDELANVKGIGKATVDKNRHLITVLP